MYDSATLSNAEVVIFHYTDIKYLLVIRKIPFRTKWLDNILNELMIFNNGVKLFDSAVGELHRFQ